MRAREALSAVKLRAAVCLLMLADIVIYLLRAAVDVFHGTHCFIFNFQFFAAAGEFRVDRPRRFVKPCGEGRAVAYQLRGGPAHRV